MIDHPTRPAGIARRFLGAALLICGVLPVYRMLATPDTGLAGAATVAQTDVQLALLWAGTLLLLPVALLAALFLPAARLDRMTSRSAARLARWHTRTLAWVLAILSAGLGVAFAWFALGLLPAHFDSIPQLLQARFWADGQLAGPNQDGGGFWAIQNAVFTANGWVSQYPPGHVAVLTVFLLFGVPWLAGPFMIGFTSFFTTLLIRALMPERAALAHLAAIMCAIAPFFLFLGASYMNHVTAAAGIALGAWALARAWTGQPAWALLAGFGFGFAMITRPLSALAMSTAIFLLLPAVVVSAPRLRAFATRAGYAALGALLPLGALLLYNNHYFGSPTTFGYELALGPQMRLGFHLDPWGNTYGLGQAIAYTAADLLTLGLHLFETPLSAMVVIGAFLLAVPALTAVERLLLGWALAPVAVNFFYWHHGLFMGPRMLHEAAPAWALLSVIAAVRLVEMLPRTLVFDRLDLRAGLTGALITAVAAGLLLLAPQRASSYANSDSIMRIPIVERAAPGLVFVHDAWIARTGMTLAAHGYRLDTVETLLRQNSTCAVHHLAAFEHAGDSANARALRVRLDTVPRSANLPRTVFIAPGDPIRVMSSETLTPPCMQQARSDSAGILDLAPLVWRGDLPGAEPRGMLYVRDLGPARNAALMAQHPTRTAYVYAAAGPVGAVVYPYADGMRRLWR